MASILIRNLSDETKKALRIKAAENGRSMTEEARSLIEAGIIQKQRQKNQPKTSNWVDNLLTDLRAIGDAELELLPRDEAPLPLDFSGPEFEPSETE
jgi:antitoxin FitA